MQEDADKGGDKKGEEDDGELVQRQGSQLDNLGLLGHSYALWSCLWQVEQTYMRPHTSPSN